MLHSVFCVTSFILYTSIIRSVIRVFSSRISKKVLEKKSAGLNAVCDGKVLPRFFSITVDNDDIAGKTNTGRIHGG